MADLFPRTIGAGTSLAHTIISAAWPAPEWSIVAVLRGPAPLDLALAHDGSSHRLQVPAAVTSTWHPGRYAMSLRARRGDEVHEIDAATITIRPDISQLPAGADQRSHVERVLEAIEAVLERRATLDQEEYRINNRELRRTPIADLLKLRDRYRAELARMRAIGRGDLFGCNVRVVFR